MRIIGYIIQKEFRQIFRDKTMLPVMFLVPLVQLLILVYAATMEMNSIKLEIIDMDNSSLSNELKNKFKGTPFFIITESKNSLKEAESRIIKQKSDAFLQIPENFEKELYISGETSVQLSIDAVNNMKAGLINVYASGIIQSFNKDVLFDISHFSQQMSHQKKIQINFSHWYNTELNFKFYMLPGILVVLVTIIGMFLTALNLVREKENGTIEQINVTPIKKYQFLLGKLVPFWIIALFELGLGLTIGRLLFRIPVEGNLLVLFSVAGVYLITVLAIGLLISTLSSTQQQVMFLSFFFMLTFILMSGIFTPEESMPVWGQKLNIINPFTYFMRSIRMILLKGSGFKDIMPQILSLSIYGITMMFFAIWRYRKIS